MSYSEHREVPLEDLWICIDAHDKAVNVEGQSGLVTTDIADLGRDERRELILSSTELDDVVFVAVAK